MNVVPRDKVKKPSSIENIENHALKLASDEKHNVNDAIANIVGKYSSEIQELAELLSEFLNQDYEPISLVSSLQVLEKKRLKGISLPPNVGTSTYYKRNINTPDSFWGRSGQRSYPPCKVRISTK